MERVQPTSQGKDLGNEGRGKGGRESSKYRAAPTKRGTFSKGETVTKRSSSSFGHLCSLYSRRDGMRGGSPERIRYRILCGKNVSVSLKKRVKTGKEEQTTVLWGFSFSEGVIRWGKRRDDR